MGDFATLRFGPKNASRRVVFGHGIDGLDKFANTFIKGAVEHWSTDPRLRHVEFIVPEGQGVPRGPLGVRLPGPDVQDGPRVLRAGARGLRELAGEGARVDGDDDALGAAAGVGFIK